MKSIVLRATIGSLLLASLAAHAQQTIFNVPSADVLDRGHLYLEADELWRPSDPEFSVSTIRGVVGLGGHVEAGINFGGFVTPGRSTPTATAAVKWQPVSTGGFSVTGGAQGLFYMRGATDGTPSVLGYAHAAYRLSATGSRLTLGGWASSSGYADAGPSHGVLAAIEQPLGRSVSLAADWYSGKSGVGYFTPGAVITLGSWTIYPAYSIKNGDSHGNAYLVELGFTK